MIKTHRLGSRSELLKFARGDVAFDWQMMAAGLKILSERQQAHIVHSQV